jgi:molybdate transport system substrate-binding protein
VGSLDASPQTIDMSAPITVVSSMATRAVLAELARSFTARSAQPVAIESVAELFDRWGITEIVRDRMVVAPPGVSVGALIARGDAELGFQQLSELINIKGVDVVGPMPPAVQITTTFSAAVGVTSIQRDSAQAWLSYLTSPDAAEAKRRRGMEPV